MSIFPSDVIIKNCIDLGLQDLRRNQWVFYDIFSDFLENPLLKDKYGLKEIQAAKDFILNNEIPILLKFRVDKEQIPCITLSLGQSQEDKSNATLGDMTSEVNSLQPSQIDKPIRYIIPPFNISSYDSDTGIIEIPTSVADYRYISPGMVIIDPETGNGFIIIEKAGINGIKIAAGSALPTGKLGIIVQFNVYRARREQATSAENYTIGCHANDPSTLLFLFGCVKYNLYRYREFLLETQGFQISSISCTDIQKNELMGIENCYSRFISLSGIVQETWLKTPYRVIETVSVEDPDSDTFVGGIKILSNKDTVKETTDEDPWMTIEDDSDNN